MSYAQLSFVFLLDRDFCFNLDDTDTFFLLQKDFYISLDPFPAFFLFFCSKRYWLLSCASSWSIYLFFLIIFINQFYICLQKNIKKLLIVILVVFFFNFLHWNFLHQNFSSSKILSKLFHQNFLHNQSFLPSEFFLTEFLQQNQKKILHHQ